MGLRYKPSWIPLHIPIAILPPKIERSTRTFYYYLLFVMLTAKAIRRISKHQVYTFSRKVRQNLLAITMKDIDSVMLIQGFR